MQKPSKLAQTPQIRFAEFTDPWERRKLGEVTSLITKGTTPIDKSGKGEVNFIKIENINSSNGEIIPEMKISESEHNGYLKRSQLQENDILFSIAGTLGRVSIVKTSILPANTNQAIAIIRTKEGDLNYISTVLKGNAVADFIKKNPTIGAQPNLSLEQVGTLEIPYPSLAEQNKIGELFANLDNLITLHQSKFEKLQKIKKSCLQNLFPQNNQNTPKIRFKNFTDEWEVRKLGEIANYRRGSFPQPYGKSEWYDGEEAKPFIQVADITDSMNLVSDTKQKISKLAQPMSVFAEKGSVLVTLQGSIGRVAIIQYGAFVDRTVLIFEKYKIDIDNLFWAYIIKQKFIKEARKAPGGTIKTITKEALSDFDLLLSNYNEQEKIGAFFSKLDKLIALQQRKVEKLKNIKKALLNKMFI